MQSGCQSEDASRTGLGNAEDKLLSTEHVLSPSLPPAFEMSTFRDTYMATMPFGIEMTEIRHEDDRHSTIGYNLDLDTLK
jgi:hypothetical protein